MEATETASIMGIPYYKTRLSKKKKKNLVWYRSTLILLGTGSPRVLGYLGTGSPEVLGHLGYWIIWGGLTSTRSSVLAKFGLITLRFLGRGSGQEQRHNLTSDYAVLQMRTSELGREADI